MLISFGIYKKQTIRGFCREVGIITRVWAGRSRFRIPAGVWDSSLLQIIHTGSAIQPASYIQGREVYHNTQLQQVTRLRMNGAIHLHPLCAFTSSRQEQLHFPLSFFFFLFLTNLLRLQVLFKMYREIIGDDFECWFCLMTRITRHWGTWTY